jgi:hypothetical protein
MWTNAAAIITALATLATVVLNFILQLRQSKTSAENGKKIDENTKVTKEASAKLDEVHAATNVLTASASGTYVALKDEKP